MIKFLSWGEINDFVGNILNKKPDKKVKFLATQFKEFIEKEVQPMLKWSGFPKDFCRQWEKCYRFREEHRKLVKDIAVYIEKQLDDIELIEKNLPKSETKEGDGFGWTLWSKRKDNIRLYAGIYGADESVSSPDVFLSWWMSWHLYDKIKNKPRFLEIKNKLESKNFVFDERNIEVDLNISEFCGIPIENQRKKIFGFINKTIENFNNSGIVRFLQK